MKLTARQKVAFGIGAVGKDMVYALSASYVMYYYQDIIGLRASFVGLILMIARIFDALNDPFMGVIVGKTRSRWGRFRPWIFSGTVLNAFVLYAMFAAPYVHGAGMMVYFSVIYILWGMTYTMMDIPYWSMIPAVTSTPKDREHLSVVGRTCAGVGAALIAMGTMLLVGLFGGNDEREGFRWVALLVSVVFVVTEIICCIFVKEQNQEKMQTATVKEMFRALFHNDQALIVVLAIVLINSALYLTSNLIIYFFKYDFGGTDWKTSYTLFSTVGGAFQILGMMVAYPLLRKKLSNTKIFVLSIFLALAGYAMLLLLCLTGLSGNLYLLFIPAAVVFAANGMLSVLTTLFLSHSVDYGQLKTGRREESLIFSMQTFVVKAASGISVFIAGIGLDVIGLAGNTDETGPIVAQSAGTIFGLRLLMTVLPVVGLLAALLFFRKKFRLTDEAAAQNAEKVKALETSHEAGI
jgi:melibiose permease